ncbi:MAG: sel1 repeat family protein [Deltaproteobacteria bacterium]|nr:sel1 repeat family protein [Deltaproteobacteria bacterium]
MSNIQLDLKVQSFTWTLILLAIPVCAVLSVFHGCDVRHPIDKRSCLKGSVQACVTVGDAYASVHPDDLAYLFSMIFGYHHAAKTWYGHACDLGSSTGCYQFGVFSRSSGDDWFTDSFNVEDARKGFQRACDAKVADACLALGEMAHDASDEAQATHFYGLACDGKSAEGCFNLGLARWAGRGGLSANAHEGQKLIDQACTLGDSNACKRLNNHWLKLDLAVEACADGGSTDACAEADDLKEQSKSWPP